MACDSCMKNGVDSDHVYFYSFDGDQSGVTVEKLPDGSVEVTCPDCRSDYQWNSPSIPFEDEDY